MGCEDVVSAHRRLSIVIVSVTLGASGVVAQERRSTLDLPEKKKRKLLAPLIRAAKGS